MRLKIVTWISSTSSWHFCIFGIHMLHISCLQEILKEPRGAGRGFAWTGRGCCPGPGIYCAEKKNHGSSCRETLAKSAGSCCLRPPEESVSPKTINTPRSIPRAINPLVSPFGVQSSAVQTCNSEAWEAQLMDCLPKAGLVISLILEYSDYIQHARLQVLGWFSLYCCAIHCKTSLIGEPVSAAIWDWHVRKVHAWY